MKNLKVKIMYEANVVIDEFEEKRMTSELFEKLKEEAKKELDIMILTGDGRNETSDIDIRWEVEK